MGRGETVEERVERLELARYGDERRERITRMWQWHALAEVLGEPCELWHRLQAVRSAPERSKVMREATARFDCQVLARCGAEVGNFLRWSDGRRAGRLKMYPFASTLTDEFERLVSGNGSDEGRRSWCRQAFRIAIDLLGTRGEPPPDVGGVGRHGFAGALDEEADEGVVPLGAAHVRLLERATDVAFWRGTDAVSSLQYRLLAGHLCALVFCEQRHAGTRPAATRMGRPSVETKAGERFVVLRSEAWAGPAAGTLPRGSWATGWIEALEEVESQGRGRLEVRGRLTSRLDEPPTVWCPECFWPEALCPREATRALKELLQMAGFRRCEAASFTAESCGRTIAAWKSGCAWSRVGGGGGEASPIDAEADDEMSRAWAKAQDTERFLKRVRVGRLRPEEGRRHTPYARSPGPDARSRSPERGSRGAASR